MLFFVEMMYLYRMNDRLDCQEQRLNLSSGNKEDTCASTNVIFFLRIYFRNVITDNQHYPKAENTKRNKLETKISKPQNENICLTYLNTESKRNFHYLSIISISLWRFRYLLLIAKTKYIQPILKGIWVSKMSIGTFYTKMQRFRKINSKIESFIK